MKSLLLGLCLAAVATAQDPKPAPAPGADAKGADAKVERSAQSMREQITTGVQVTSHVRLALRLRNGYKLSGVVKDGRFVERVDGLRFVDATAKEKGAGIRIWYTGGRRNFVFVPFADVTEYEVLERLTQKQLDEIDAAVRVAEQKQRAGTSGDAATTAPTSAESGVPSLESTPAAPTTEVAGQQPRSTARAVKSGDASSTTGAGTKTESSGEGTATTELEQQKVYLALLKQYPPAGGWNRAKRDEIARRKNVVGAVPSEKEQQFVAKFAEWEKACAAFGVGGREGAEAPVTETKSGKRGKTETESNGEGEGTEEETARGKRRRTRGN
jgi:hypothetical protein